jgi:hypothetical protein
MLPIELKTGEKILGGQDRLDFGTVRPRVQIPGPRPMSCLRYKRTAVSPDAGPV